MEWTNKIPTWIKLTLKALLWLVIGLLVFFVVIYLIPRTINCLILKPATFKIVGDGTHWLSFWGSYLATIASFVMAFLTWQSLRQNKKQLQEMKNQWENEHRPYVEVYKIKEDIPLTDKCRIEFLNFGLSVATSITFRIEEGAIEHLSEEGKIIAQSFGDFRNFVLLPREAKWFVLYEHRNNRNEEKYLIGGREVSKEDYEQFLGFIKEHKGVLKIAGTYNGKYKFEAEINNFNSRKSLQIQNN